MNEQDACETSEMIARLRLGDHQAFAILVDAHERMVTSLAQSMGFAGADLDDAAAEVFAEVFQSLPAFAGRSRLRTWIYTIAFRRMSRLRKTAKNPHHMKSVELNEQEITADESIELSPLQQAANAEINRRLWHAVTQLDDRSAAAVELHYRQDLPLPEIADVLACPIGTVKTLLFRARQTLRQSIELRDEGRAVENGSSHR